MMKFLAHEFSRLGGSSFTLALVFVRTFNCFFFRHEIIFSLICAIVDGVEALKR
ncbi:MAG TPA: hypothetical protein VMF08_17250 [Candidatus Sulfotelmatobacter sp.]|nr:hypothetical protein [Candidatus Sulfotelmatobacter sp.]